MSFPSHGIMILSLQCQKVDEDPKVSKEVQPEWCI